MCESDCSTEIKINRYLLRTDVVVVLILLFHSFAFGVLGVVVVAVVAYLMKPCSNALQVIVLVASCNQSCID